MERDYRLNEGNTKDFNLKSAKQPGETRKQAGDRGLLRNRFLALLVSFVDEVWLRITIDD